MRQLALVIFKMTIKTISLLLLIGHVQYTIAQDNSETSAGLINEAYQSFLAGDHDNVIEIMSQLGLAVMNKKSIELVPSGVLDSLVFERDGAKAFFTSTDIGYIKNVKVIIQIKSTDPGSILNEVKSKFDAAGYKANADFSVQNICAVFEERGNHWVVDKRYKRWTYTNFETLYDHLMTIYDNELILSLSETVPDSWIDNDEYAALSPTVSAVEVKSHF